VFDSQVYLWLKLAQNTMLMKELATQIPIECFEHLKFGRVLGSLRDFLYLNSGRRWSPFNSTKSIVTSRLEWVA